MCFNCLRETLTPKSVVYYCIAYIAALIIPVLCVYQIVIYYTTEVREFSLNEYFTGLDDLKSELDMRLLIDIQVTSSSSCDEFGGLYEPLFKWKW